MEKAWRVKIPIGNTNVSSKEKATINEFGVFEHSEEDAKLRALIKATKIFPPNEGWTYDVDNLTIREISHAEMGDILDEHRSKVVEEGSQRIEDALAEFEKATGVRLRKPE